MNSFTKEELRDCFTLKRGCDCDTKNKLGKKWDDYGKQISLKEKVAQNCLPRFILYFKNISHLIFR